MKPVARTWIFVLVACGLLVAAWAAYTLNRSPAPSGVPPAMAGGSAAGPAKAGGPAGGAFPVAVEVARVVASDVLDQASAVGTVKSSQSVVLRPEVAGRIDRISFRDGAVVEKGAVLLTLDAAIQEAEVQQARANRDLAEAHDRRQRELLARHFVSQQAVDSALAALEVQRAALQLAEAKLAKTRIRAPFAGVVGLRNVSVGDYVKDGQDLVNIEDVARLKVDFRLPESYVDRVKPGLPVELTSDALPGQRYVATLDAVDPQLDAAGRSLSCRAWLVNSGGALRPGMFVRVAVRVGEIKGALMVPEQAVVSGARPSVIKVVEGKAASVPVRLGLRQNAQVAVLEGLSDGDLVITAGQLKVRDGAPVRPIGEGTSPAGQGSMQSGGQSGMQGGGQAGMAGSKP